MEFKKINSHNIFVLFNALVSYMANDNIDAKKWIEEIAKNGFRYHDKKIDRYFKMQASLELATFQFASIMEQHRKFVKEMVDREKSFSG